MGSTLVGAILNEHGVGWVSVGDSALGGIAGVSQLQLLQPFFGLALAGLLLGEPVAPAMVLVILVVATCVFGAKNFAR